MLQVGAGYNADTVDRTWEYAFFDCYNLQNITIPNGITKIGRYTFTHCEKLTSAVIPEGVTTVGKCAFCYCRKLYSLQIPASITELSDDALYYTENLMEVIYTGTKAQWAAVKIGQHNGFDWDQGNAPLHFNFHCTDGDILPTSTASENSITAGTASTSGSSSKPPLLMPRRARSMWCLSAAPAVTR